MKPERWQHVKEILNAALERDPEERAAFVATRCGADEAMRNEVEALLVADEQAGTFAETPAIEVMAGIMTDQSNRLAGQVLAHYKIIERLGVGGMGEVYLAEDKKLGRKVALKVLPESLTSDEPSKRRFIQEAKAASALNHPHIITIYEIASDGQRDFIAMEYVEGETLRDVLSDVKMKTARAVEFTAQAASALAAAHEAGIIHRDIKPENLMVTRTSQIKILDFGLAKLIEERAPSLVASDIATEMLPGTKIETMPGTILGTVAYMSPEQAEGLPLDRRSDIFSLGVVLYEMLAAK